jgi:cellulose synthase/poly-beta-1,6-N-acetylglucosamine synthase-like glycosyltransferase
MPGLQYATGEYIITIDSDTVPDPEALVNLLDPRLRDQRIGATTADVKVLSGYENFLTRMGPHDNSRLRSTLER